jgi:uncharacterized phiE125 gp8 family phage protein
VALALVTAPTSEPVSLSEQKAHLRFDGDEDDAYIAACITAARQWIEGQTKRAIMAQTWDYGIDNCWPIRDGGTRIDFPMNPIAAQASPESITITYVDTNGVSQSLASTQFIVANRLHGSYIVPAYGVTWPDVRWQPDAITLRFVAGDSSTVPADLKQAVMILAAQFYEERDTGATASAVVEALISPHRKVTF